jgi:hypothetical protein
VATKMNITYFDSEVEELKGFFKNIWGILTAISIFLSNLVAYFVPVYYGLPRSLFVTIVALVTIYVLLMTFGQRRSFKLIREEGGEELQKTWRNVARRSFKTGFLLLCLYLFLNFSIASPLIDITKNDNLMSYVIPGRSLENVLVQRFIDSILTFISIILLIIYSFSFANIMKSFMILGMVEYLEFLDTHKLALKKKERDHFEEGYG